MCCFSRPVEHVSNTSIFARQVAGGKQAIVYSMEINAREDLAMILPIPVAQPASEDAVQFISLKDYPNLFAELQQGFPVPLAAPAPAAGGEGFRSAPLPVIEVGNFSASFVPTPKDFARLDDRFRLPSGTWDKLGQYANFGFAVFKLRKGHSQIHPMAFTFPSAPPAHLFFPTVHIHDGEIHARADFDHTLYCQISRSGLRSFADWEESGLPASRFVNTKMAQNLIVPDRHVFRKPIFGQHPNKDVFQKIA